MQRGDGGSNDVTFAVRHTTSEGYGPGLGVYLAQRMVELHGGRLEITADGGNTVGSTAQELRQVILAEIARYRKIVTENAIKLEE